MRRVGVATLLLAVGAFGPAASSELVVVATTGVLEPESLEAGQSLEAGDVLRLEPWGRAVLRETAGCGLTQVIVGAPEHRLAPVEDCSRVADPMEIVAMIQQGAAFAAPLRESGSEQAASVVQMIANEPCVFLARVSDEGGNARQCPSGYGLRGLRCTGEHCDNKDLLCCPYLGGAPDPAAKEIRSRVISEEFPNVVQSKHFLAGLACNGPFCDNILPYEFRSKRLANDRQCDWTAWSTEEPDAWLDCGDGKLASGIRCAADYCGGVALYCCGTRVE